MRTAPVVRSTLPEVEVASIDYVSFPTCGTSPVARSVAANLSVISSANIYLGGANVDNSTVNLDTMHPKLQTRNSKQLPQRAPRGKS